MYIYQFFVCCQSRNLPLRGQILKEIIFIDTKQHLLATTKVSGNSEILHFRGPMILTDNDSQRLNQYLFFRSHQSKFRCPS